MSLLDCYNGEYALMEKKGSTDGEGGNSVEWTEGAKFTARRAHDSSLQARIAEREGLISTYTFLVQKDLPIKFHDFIKELSTGDTFYVTSNPDDHAAPAISTFGFKYFTAEKRALP